MRSFHMHAFGMRTYGQVRKYGLAIVSVTLLLFAVGCGDFFVSPGTVVSIKLTPVNPTLRVGQTQQYAATATMSDGTTKDVTTSVTWTTGNSGVATISSTGLVTAQTSGTTTVTATSGTIASSTNLTVTF